MENTWQKRGAAVTVTDGSLKGFAGYVQRVENGVPEVRIVNGGKSDLPPISIAWQHLRLTETPIHGESHD